MSDTDTEAARAPARRHAAFRRHPGSRDWAGGDRVSAMRLNSSQLAWFFSDTFIGPAGPTIGFSHISGFAHNAVVVQTRTGHGSAFVTATGGGACTGPGRPGNAAPVVGDSPWPAGTHDRYWDEDGLRTGGTIVKFYNRYAASTFPFVPLGTVIASFDAGQLSTSATGPGTARRPGRPWSGCRPTPRRPAGPRSCGAPRCCASATRSTSTARRARTCPTRSGISTWPGSR